MKTNLRTLSLSVCFILYITSSCSNYKYVDDSAFIGDWQVKGRPIYEGLVIRISRQNNELKGTIVRIPANKYAKTFLDSGAVWVSQIERMSNYGFKVEENKIASELFSQYGLSTKLTFYATFSKDQDKLLLSGSSLNESKNSKIFYQRVASK